MIKKGLKFFEESFLIYSFILFFVLIAYSKWLIYHDTAFVDVRIIKAGIISMFLMGNVTLKNFKIFTLLALMFILYSTGQFFISESFSINSINVFLKFIFLILVLEFANNLTSPEKLKRRLFNIFEWVMLLNSLFIFMGALFSIKVFNTYQGSRFGYNGFFDAVSTGSYAYIITLFYFLLAYKSKVVRNWKFIFIFISCFFIGTKAVYVSMVFTLAYIIITATIPYKKTIITGTAILSIAAGYFFFFRYGIFNLIRESDGLISAMLSYRNELLIKSTLPYIQEKWGWFNYLFGGVSNFDLRAQMELVDVFFFWGLLGGSFYWIVFYKSFIPFKLTKTGIIFVFFLMFIVLLAGNFFTYSFVSLLLLVLRFILEDNSKESV